MRGLPMPDLLSELPASGTLEAIGDGAVVLHGLAAAQSSDLLAAVDSISAAAPFRRMSTPGGHTMSVAMTNCGDLGWVTDRRGYRYQPTDPLSGKPWPGMPAIFREMSAQAAANAGYPDFRSDACLINRYEPGARLTLHQDRNERDMTTPIVSVSLGLSATFLFGGTRRSDRARRIRLDHGDVVVWGGTTRLYYHGIEPLADGWHAATGRRRVNLTFRKAG